MALCLAASAHACSVPVYRYALERWPADPFEALVYHRGGLTRAESEMITAARESTDANLKFRTINLDTETDEDIAEIWEDEQSPGLPWVVVTYPRSYPYIGPVASGPLTPEALTGFSTSPMRQRLAEQLANSATAVWLLLESGDSNKDEAAASALEKRLRHLESNLELPTLAQEDIDAGLTTASQDDLKIEFHTLRLSRTDPAEKVFVEMLLDSEEDLSEAEGPVVFPVFGRGRVLYALIDKGIHAGTIDTAAEYIVGSCSCQVKEQNPGVDLLMGKDWDSAIGGSLIPEKELPPLEGAGALVDKKTDEATDPVPATGIEEPPANPVKTNVRSGMLKIFVGIAIALFFAITATTLFIMKRNTPS